MLKAENNALSTSKAMGIGHNSSVISPDRGAQRNVASFIGAQLGEGSSPALRIKKTIEGESGTTGNHELIREEDEDEPY